MEDFTLDLFADDSAADETTATADEETEAVEAEGIESEGAETEESDQTSEEQHEEEPTSYMTVKYNGEEKGLSQEEAISFAQKGMNYDKVKSQLDQLQNEMKTATAEREELAQARESLQWLSEMAKEQNMTVDEMIDATRANVMSRKTGKDIEVCKGIIANERKARELEKREAGMNAPNPADEQKEIIRKDLNEFWELHPDKRKPEDIPQEVWDVVNSGNKSLVDAYNAFELKEKNKEIDSLKQEIEKLKQKSTNKARSTGSMGNSTDKNKSDKWDLFA